MNSPFSWSRSHILETDFPLPPEESPIILITIFFSPFLPFLLLPSVEVEEYNKSLTLEYYQEVFEGPFLRETGQYYRQQASKLVAESSCSEYMHCIVNMLQTARRRGTSFLHQTSVTKVSKVQCI